MASIALARLSAAALASLLVVAVSGATGCGDEKPLAGAADTGVVLPDAAESDAGADDTGANDTGANDTGANDAGTADAGEPEDTGVPADTGVPVDTGVDAGPADSGVSPFADTDGDGISDVDEGSGAVDTDRDGTPDSADADSDGDGIPDAVEGGDADPRTPPRDTDRDGTPDFRDGDSDGDTIADMLEGQGDGDGDGDGNWIDLDSDGDNIPDRVELLADPDGDQVPAFVDLDSDGDSIPDRTETAADSDGDGTGNFLDLDADGDTLADMIEGTVDPDGDQLPAFLDLDADGDSIPDMVEGTADVDADTLPNFLDLDADGDWIGDRDEGLADPDGDQAPSYLDTDADGDGIADADEAGDQNVGTPPVDSESDGIPNYLDLDSDNDLVADLDEGVRDTDGDGLPDRLDIDADNDAIFDVNEAGDLDLSTPPLDTDGDGLGDYRDTDSDGDTIVDITEGVTDRDGDGIANFRDADADGDGFLDAVEAGDADPQTVPVNTDRDVFADFLDFDSDDDGLADLNERGCNASTSRTQTDSDGDGFIDPAEIAVGSNPCNPASGIPGFYFILPPNGPQQTAPLEFSNTGLDRADLALNVDTTGSMGEEIANIRSSLSTLIIPSVAAVIPDVGFGVSAFEDFPVPSFGDAGAGDLPFRLLTRITTRAADAQAAVNALTVRSGLDLPESGLEAIFQIAAGVGVGWGTGSIPAFNPALNRIPNVADGTIGGVGFRNDALPIIVHVTDAPAHTRAEYQATSAAIDAAAPNTVDNALANVGARVVGIANSRLPHDPYGAACSRQNARIFADLRTPIGTDVDYFAVTTVAANRVLAVETFGDRLSAPIDTMVAVFDAAGNQLAMNDDIVGSRDSRLAAVTLPAAGTYTVGVTAYGDADFNGSGGGSAAYYGLEVRLDGNALTTAQPGCRLDDSNTRGGATPLVAFATAMPTTDYVSCRATCEQVVDSLVFPTGMAARTGALAPPCAWDFFGGGRPGACAAGQCCTGVGGAGLPPNENGLCPLSFQVLDNGTGVSSSIVGGIQALVRFSTFTVTTQVRPDPTELANNNFDTTCFIQGVVPRAAVPPNACAPTPQVADLLPPSGVNDSYTNVVPGTRLTFDVLAQNQQAGSTTPCRNSTAVPQLYRAFIDVIADGVTVLETRDVTIIVPPTTAGGSN
jgi:hypothetical protein